MTNTYYIKVISATKLAVYEDAEFTRPASFNFDDFSGVPLVTKIQNSSLGITYDSFFVNPISSVSTGVLLTYTYYAGSIGTFTVPDNVSTITVTVVGAGGGSGGNYQNATTLGNATSGTAGSIVLGDLSVQSGQVLTIYPGFGGSRGLQSWNSGTGGAGGVNYFSAYSGSTGGNGNGGGGGGGAASVIISNSSVLVLAAGGSGGSGGTGAAGGFGGGVNVVPAGLSTSTSTNGGAAGNFAAYYAASYGTGGAGALSAVNSALTGVPNYSGAFTGIPTNNGNGTDFIIFATLKSGSGGYTCYRTQAQQGAAFYGPGSALNIYAGRTVTGVNTSGNGGSSFWLSGPDTYSDGSDGYVIISIVNSRYTFYLSTEASTTGVTITPGSLGLSYVSGKTDLVYVVNTGVTVNAASTATSALIIYGFNSGDTVTIQNYGTIAGVGGAGGRNNSGGYFEENGNVDGLGYGGDVPNNPYGQNGPAVGGSPGSAGGPAIGITTQAYYTRFNVYNYNLITGGGGGAGGGGGNNVGGGSAGNGGVAIQVLGATNYLAAGTYSFTVPAGITSIRVKAIAAGGGGGAGNDGGYVHYGWGGGGGGSGYETSSDVVVTPGETLTVVVGTGGAGGPGGCGPGGNPGSTGGSTELKRGATTLLSVNGGSGGASNASGSNSGGSGGNPGSNASSEQGVGFGGQGGSSSESFGGAGGPGGGCGTGSGTAGSAGSGGGGGGAQNGSCCGHPGGRGGDGFLSIFTLTGQTQVSLYNQTAGAIIAGGGGGGAGWGNRSAGSTEGGTPGQDGYITSNGGGNFGAMGVAGAVITGGAVKIYTGVQTVTLS